MPPSPPNPYPWKICALVWYVRRYFSRRNASADHDARPIPPSARLIDRRRRLAFVRKKGSVAIIGQLPQPLSAAGDPAFDGAFRDRKPHRRLLDRNSLAGEQDGVPLIGGQLAQGPIEVGECDRVILVWSDTKQAVERVIGKVCSEAPFMVRMLTWWVSRSSSAPVRRSDARTCVQSSNGRLDVMMIEPRS